MPTALLAPNTAAADSADIVVTTTPVSVGLYTAAGGNIAGEVVIPIKRKNPSGTYGGTSLSLTGAQPNVVLTAPGTYQVSKPITTSAIGIQTD